MDEELILLKSLADRFPLFGYKLIKMPGKNNSKLTYKQRTVGYRLCIFYCIPFHNQLTALQELAGDVCDSLPDGGQWQSAILKLLMGYLTNEYKRY